MITLGPDECRDLARAAGSEWLETNGIGGYASGTVAGLHTRRYHGLLVAATRPPLGRKVLLSKFEEKLIVEGREYELSANRYPGTVYPSGFEYIAQFRLDPFPIWTYEAGGVRVEKSVFMPHGENAVVMRWRIVQGARADVRLELRPLVASRDHHHLQHESPGARRDIAVSEGHVRYSLRPGDPEIAFSHNAADVVATGDWYRDLEYTIEQERGFDFHEDLFQPFVMKFDLAEEAIVIVSLDTQHEANEAEGLAALEIDRRERLIAAAKVSDEASRRLVLAADQFVVERGGGKTVIAGYHWFSDWGRDTMIALPGLTLATGQPDVARDIILEYSRHISDGMLPNRFPDEGDTPEYNTVDATLWYFEAIRAYVEATGDLELVRDLYPKLADIVRWHIRGTRYGIMVDSDGLLHAGEAGTQLTWMDAKVGDEVFTPRMGKPVEIQALWHNALRIMEDWAREVRDDVGAIKFSRYAAKASRSFNSRFWNYDASCLYDVIDGDSRDGSIRPNQIFAVSLTHSMLPRQKARKVVDVVERELLTPVGLRSLAPSDPSYVGTYLGSPYERDSAYHQGTVWAWLIGHFVDAYRKVHSHDPGMEDRVGQMVAGLEASVSRSMLGQVGEIFDGDAPHAPRGAAAQAWSVAELLRVKKSVL